MLISPISNFHMNLAILEFEQCVCLAGTFYNQGKLSDKSHLIGELTLACSPPQDLGPDVTPLSPSAAAAKSHVIVLVNGLFGSSQNWDVVLEKLQERLPAASLDSTLIVASRASSRTETYDGIDRCLTGWKLHLPLEQNIAMGYSSH